MDRWERLNQWLQEIDAMLRDEAEAFNATLRLYQASGRDFIVWDYGEDGWEIYAPSDEKVNSDGWIVAEEGGILASESVQMRRMDDRMAVVRYFDEDRHCVYLPPESPSIQDTFEYAEKAIGK